MRGTDRLMTAGIVVFALLGAFGALAGDNPSKTPFVLSEGSSFQSGCFAPCLCPLREPVPLKGTFELTAGSFEGPLEKFLVTGVVLAASDRRFTGAGTFTIGRGMQRLTLELSDDRGQTKRFDSGWVPSHDLFPTIGVGIDFNDRYCYDEPMQIRAAPVAAGLLSMAVSREALSWSLLGDATGYDVIDGDLGDLRATGGNFTYATANCLADDIVAYTLPIATTPLPGEGRWFLVRGTNSPANDTWDSDGEGQTNPRDDSIGSATRTCP